MSTALKNTKEAVEKKEEAAEKAARSAWKDRKNNKE